MTDPTHSAQNAHLVRIVLVDYLENQYLAEIRLQALLEHLRY